ncbi:hypothetical protein DACRYDRAFT_43541, partial [Dacryopinax primogenitus]
IRWLTTSGYHPCTKGKTEQYNGILELYLKKMNTTGDPTRWNEFLDTALFVTQVKQQTTAKWSPFELLYG